MTCASDTGFPPDKEVQTVADSLNIFTMTVVMIVSAELLMAGKDNKTSIATTSATRVANFTN